MHLLTPEEARDALAARCRSRTWSAPRSCRPTARPTRRHHAGAGQGRAHGRRRASRGLAVTGVEIDRGRVIAVMTAAGRDRCEKVVICAGQWTRQLARMAGVNVPLVSVQHQYLITEPIPGVRRDLPTLRDPDRLTYYKEEVGGLVMGGYEPNPKPWAERRRAGAISRSSCSTPDWDHFEPTMELALGAGPGARHGRRQAADQRARELHPRWQLHHRRGAGDRAGTSSAPASTPSASPRRRRRHGARRMGRQGRAALRRLAGRHPPLRRAASPTPDWVRTRTLEAYGKHYTMAWPFEEYDAAGRAPLAALPAAAGAGRRASARSSAGSGPTGSPLPGEEPPTSTATGGRTGSRPWGASTVRRASGSALFDQTSFAKFLLVGGTPRRAVVALRQRRRQAAGEPGLHADAQRQGRHRVRPDRGAARRDGSTS